MKIPYPIRRLYNRENARFFYEYVDLYIDTDTLVVYEEYNVSFGFPNKTKTYVKADSSVYIDIFSEYLKYKLCN